MPVCWGFFPAERVQNCLKPRPQSCSEALTVSRLQWALKTDAPAATGVLRALKTHEKVICIP